ncbi:hypothetical protein [Nocardia sp. NPDC052566]|uniref:hypothetical protein n=1 Tax=Nocardia sp. NPDC052566 TaxID=3364330 RepID=UPI0037C604DD
MSNRNQQPACADCPDAWDLDVGKLGGWIRALGLCRTCPLLDECTELRAKLQAIGQPPRSMIWAGVAYDNSGNAIADLRRYKPPRIIRPAVRTFDKSNLRGGVTKYTCKSETTVKRVIVLGAISNS